MRTWISDSRDINASKKCFNLWIGVNAEPSIVWKDVFDYHYQSFDIHAGTPDLAYAVLSQNG